MKSMNRIYALAVVAIFLISMLSPLGVYLFTEDKKISVAEKRELETFPDVSWDYESVISFPKKFDAYFQDHFGFRDALVTFYNQVNLKIFGVTSSPLVIKGQENWYFLIGAGSIAADFYGLKQAGLQTLDDYGQVLLERKDWLESMGIRYLFLPVPNKISVYPEKLPGRIQDMAGSTFYEQFTDYLSTTPGDDLFVNVLALLSQKKQAYQVYLRTDTHWNNVGALDTFNQIIRQLQAWFPTLQEIQADEVTQSEVRHSGDLTYMMHLEKVVSEAATVVSINQPCSNNENYQRLSSALYRTLPRKASVVPLQNGCDSKDLTALVIHDSFGKALRPYFNERFKRVVYSEKYDFNDLKDFIVALHPDVVIDERVARNLVLALQHDRELETRMLEKQYAQSDKMIFDLSSDEDKSTIMAQFDVAVSRQKDGYALLPESNDPYVTIPLDRVRPGGRYNALIELSAPKDTVLEIFYKPAGAEQYQAGYSIARKIKKGYNRLYLRFPDMDIENEIRLDPGRIRVDPKGQAKPYILHSFTVKARE